jgi:hypothetical protein
MLYQRGIPAVVFPAPGLCIPSLDVEVEWREKAYVQGPVWSRIKAQVVRQFLRGLKGKLALGEIASVGSNDRGTYLLFHCSDYDLYLTANWPFYRGLVAALTKHGSYKRAEVQEMLESELRDYVAEELIATGADGADARPIQRRVPGPAY